jgi:ribosomal protein S12 methylthiotransferase
MRVQEDISRERLQAKVGRTLTVLVDEVGPKEAVARGAADAPEIDGIVRVSPSRGLKVGEFASVRVTGAEIHDLRAEPA